MASSGDGRDPGGPVQVQFTPNGDRTLSDAVLEAIEAYKGSDLLTSDLVLYDNINPDALDELFRAGANANTVLRFDTDDVRVTLWGDGGIIIEVAERAEIEQ